MDIVQQIQDFSTEFFNHALGNMHSSKYSMKELMKDAELFSRNLTLTLVSNIMEKQTMLCTNQSNPGTSTKSKKEAGKGIRSHYWENWFFSGDIILIN